MTLWEEGKVSRVNRLALAINTTLPEMQEPALQAPIAAGGATILHEGLQSTEVRQEEQKLGVQSELWSIRIKGILDHDADPV